jgi:hypothetical protein
MTDSRQIEIAARLLELKRSGALAGLWCDAGVLRVQIEPDGPVYRRSWDWAGSLVDRQAAAPARRPVTPEQWKTRLMRAIS